MFNGMMDPELIRLAQEQMNRMSPDELAKIQRQMMSNPDLMRMASKSMNNMRPGDLKNAAEQLKHVRPEEMAEIGEKMANASPEEIASMRSRVDAQIMYQLNGAEMLKKQGNEFHNQGRFKEAANKYLLAKTNLKGVPSPKSRTLSLACSLNLMSCYLKTKQYEECIKEGSEVLEYDGKNVKALYRRGQAYRELGQLEEAVSDISMAHEVSPNDETIEEVLRDAKERLAEEGGHRVHKGVVIEEITEEFEVVSSGTLRSSSRGNSVAGAPDNTEFSASKSCTKKKVLATGSDCFKAVKDDHEEIRSFANIPKADPETSDPETSAAFGGDVSGEISPEMFKTASSMISKMSPEELQKMIQMASSFPGGNPYSTQGSSGPGLDPSNVTPDMLKAASDMMTKMSSEEMQKMYEMASSLKGKSAVPTTAAVDSSRLSSESRDNSAVNRNDVGEPSSSSNFSNTRSAPESNFPASPLDLQEQMRNQMKDPAMRQMFTSMIKNMSPDMMANMGEQFGFNLSREDAAKAQQAMSSLSPEHLDKMMCWMDRIQRGIEGARKTKNWLLGRRGMILAIFMLIVAIILHRFGFIGN